MALLAFVFLDLQVDQMFLLLHQAPVCAVLGAEHRRALPVTSEKWNRRRIARLIGMGRAALEVYTRDAAPVDWAMAQNNLGIALVSLGTREGSSTRLKEALTAYRGALNVYTRESLPAQWVMTNKNLGVVLRHLGEREASSALLQEAVAACRAALEISLGRQAVRQAPEDWHARNVLGQCLQNSKDLSGAIDELAEANRLSPKNTSILLALGIARQLSGAYNGAIGSLREALEVDPDFVLAINSLAMTQKLMGEFETADHNYVLALKTLARTIVKGWQNSADNVRVGHGASRNDLWSEYACYAGLWLAVEAGMDSMALPTGETAMRDAETAFLKGWYWADGPDKEGKKVRSFYPNFFNSFRDQLHKGGIYNHLIGNRGTVLEKLGKKPEAEAHLQ